MTTRDKINTTDTDDYLLWQALKRSDKAAYEILLKQYYAVVLSYGVRFYRDKEFVKDCVQDLFIEILQKKLEILRAIFVKDYKI